MPQREHQNSQVHSSSDSSSVITSFDELAKGLCNRRYLYLGAKRSGGWAAPS
jgi:hypothetical protein